MTTTPRKLFCLLAALFAISVLSDPALAINPTLFGPKNFRIKWWCFHLSLHRFKLKNPGNGVMTITKNRPEKRIWRGFIRINGKILSLRHFLNSDDRVLEKKLKLRSRNHILVFLLGTRGASIRVEVTKKETTPPPEVNISANPPSIEVGETSVLSWNATNANACTIQPDIGSINTNGYTAVSPTETTTYTITVDGPGGSASDSVTVVVIAPPEDLDYGIPEDDQQGGAGIVAETICILNGSNVEFRSDLTFPSPNSLGLSFEAFYNSRSQTLGVLGYGWTHTYDVSLDPAFRIEGNDFVKIVDHTGRAHYFKEESPGSYRGVFKECTHVKVEAGGFVWHRLDGTRYGFSTLGRLVWIEDEKRNRLELIYDVQGRLDNVTDTASSRALTFYYYGDGLLQRIEGAIIAAVPDGIWVTYDYDDHQNLTSATYADGSGLSYTYTDPNDIHNMTEKRNNLDHILNTWSYNEQDRAVSKFSVDGNGANKISYVSDTHVDVTDAYGTDRSYKLEEIDGCKRVSAMQGTGTAPYSNGNFIRWSYDDHKRVTETESAGGTINQYQDYDEKGNPETVKLAVNTPQERLITYTYHPHMNVPLSRSDASVLGTENKISIWDYDDDYNSIPNENPTRHLCRKVEKGFTKDSSGVEVYYEYVTTFTYNSKGQVLSTDGPLSGVNDTTTFNYDPTTGDLLSITQPLIGITIFSDYDAAGRVGKITDVNGQSRRFTYDAMGRVTLVINDADESSTKITYNLDGLPDFLTDEDGVTRTFDYDDTYGRLSRISDVKGNYIAYAYDDQGNRIEISKHDQLGTRTSRKRWSYQHPDIPGRLWKEIGADDAYTEYGYDRDGNVAFMKDPNGHTTYYTYDPLNRLATVTQPGNMTINYGYDKHGNLASVTDANSNVTTYTYDDMGRVLSTNSPDTGIMNYVYDEAGNTSRKKDAKGITVQYTWDTLNRITGIHFPDSTQDITYTYDTGTYGKGRRTGMSDPSGNTTFSYDSRGRLIQKTSTILGHKYTLGQTYTPGGRLANVIYPIGRTVDYTRDSMGRMQGLSTTFNTNRVNLVSNTTYNPFGAPKGLSTGAGGVVYNQFGECDCIEVANPGEQMERTYSYDSNRNLTSIDATNIPWYNQNFTYDALNRLINASGRYGVISYTYDNGGNRLSRSVNGEAENYSYVHGTNRLQEITGVDFTPFTYDANGNTTGIGNRVLIYNQNNRLIRVEEDSTTLGEYTYNGLGQRVIKKVNGLTTVFHYDLDGNVIAESLPDGTLITEYLYMGKIRIAKVQFASGKMYYYLNDRLGTPQIMTDDTGSIVWEASYKPFGEASVNPKSSVTNNFRFPGQYYDEETGFHYNYYRYYDSGTGRYLTPDPIGLIGGVNLFAYVENNPINWIDPIGLIRWSSVGRGAMSVFIGGVGILGGAAMAGTPTGAGQVLGTTIALAGTSSFSYGVGQIIAGFLDEEIPFMGTKEAVIKGTIRPGMTQDKILALNQIMDMLPDVAAGRVSIPPAKLVEIATYIDYLLSIGYSARDVIRELERMGYIKTDNPKPCEDD